MNYPVINITETGMNINRIRKDRNISVREIADFLGFNNTKSIYRWFRGETMPTLDNIIALSFLFGVSVNEMVVTEKSETSMIA